MHFDHYSRQAAEAVLEAEQIARDLAQTEISPEHLLLALLVQEKGIVRSLLNDLHVDILALEARLRSSAR